MSSQDLESIADSLQGEADRLRQLAANAANSGEVRLAPSGVNAIAKSLEGMSKRLKALANEASEGDRQ